MGRIAELLVMALLTSATVTGKMTSLNVTTSRMSRETLLVLVQHQMTTMEQQSAAIQSLQTQLTNFQTQFQTQQTQLQAQQFRFQTALTRLETRTFEQSAQLRDLTDVKQTVSEVKKTVTGRLDAFNVQLNAKAKLGQVAFTAYMSKFTVNVGHNGPFIFDAVVTNIGNGYNKHTGIFVAPYNGVYVFSFIMINAGAAPTIHAQIEKDGHFLGAGTSDGIGASNQWDDGSALVTTHLKKGNHVYVTRRDGGTLVNGGVYTNFSGFLLAADA